MITKEQFTKLITDYIKHNTELDTVEQTLGWEVFEWDIVEYGFRLFDIILSILFEEDAVDDINWWLYEKDNNPGMKMWDKDGNEIPTETIDDLWEIVKNYRK